MVENNIMHNDKKYKVSYTQGMFFQIKITSRYFSMMANQAFDKMKIELSFEEYIILDIIANNEGICPRDLAKMLLRDRSNTGKFISSLEKRGYIRIVADIRNNRAVKKLYITETGSSLCDDIYEKLEPYLKIIYDTLQTEEQNMVTASLVKFRKTLEEIVETKI